MDKVNFPYRSDSHLPFLHVVHDSGSWAKHGLDVNYDYEITSEDSHKMLPTVPSNSLAAIISRLTSAGLRAINGFTSAKQSVC